MMKQTLGYSVLALAVSASPAFAEQRNCLFERHTSPEGTFAINLPITVHTRKSRATVAVHPTRRDYAAKVSLRANGSAEYAFNTEVSREVITVSLQGEALWQVTFTDGRTFMHFVGKCAPARG
jgi:hypothetical protein